MLGSVYTIQKLEMLQFSIQLSEPRSPICLPTATGEEVL